MLKHAESDSSEATDDSVTNPPFRDKHVNQVNTTKFLSHLKRIDWSQYATLDDPNNAYNSFFKQYSTAYDFKKN